MYSGVCGDMEGHVECRETVGLAPGPVIIGSRSSSTMSIGSYSLYSFSISCGFCRTTAKVLEDR